MKGLARCRKASNISQKELAAMIGVGQSAVASWETGAAYPSAEKLPKIAALLGCTIADLYAPAPCAAS